MSVFKAIMQKTTKKPPTCSAVIAAAGSSLRCKGEDKLLYEIDSKPLLAYTVEAFEKCGLISEIVVVVKSEQLTEISDMLKQYGFEKITKVITGGDTRTDSVFNGVFAVSAKSKLIAIHDGARPCISSKLIEKTILTASEYHAAAPGVSVISTIKKAEKSSSKHYGAVISETVDRDNLFEIQTPQIFKAEIIKAGLTNAVNKSISLTDDCMAAELLGVPVHIVDGDRENIKVTEPYDLRIAEYLLSNKGHT